MKPIPTRKNLLWAVPLAATCMFGCFDDDDDDDGLISGPGDEVSEAVANVRGYTDTTLRGTVNFREENDSLRITAEIAGLEPGKVYGIHVHQFGNCSTPEASGGHFDPSEPHGNPLDSIGSHHRGDLPNLVTGLDSIGRLDFRTGSMSLDSGATSALGRSVVVHISPDDFETQPAGGTGERIACGVISLTSGDGIGNDTTGTGTDTTGADTTGTGIDTTLNPIPGRPY